MNSEKIEIVICLGSSCFSRGNKEVTQIVRSFIDEKGLSDAVEFKGAHCFGDCNNGPSVKINGTMYNHVSENNIYDILEENLG